MQNDRIGLSPHIRNFPFMADSLIADGNTLSLAFSLIRRLRPAHLSITTGSRYLYGTEEKRLVQIIASAAIRLKFTLITLRLRSLATLLHYGDFTPTIPAIPSPYHDLLTGGVFATGLL
jgi:hypothetical protein